MRGILDHRLVGELRESCLRRGWRLKWINQDEAAGDAVLRIGIEKERADGFDSTYAISFICRCSTAPARAS